MKLRRLYIFAVAVAALFVQGCTAEPPVDLREKDYGYVQFKLYKRASYNPQAYSSRATNDILDYLYEASKLEVELYDTKGVRMRSSIRLSASNSESAEFGMRSEKLKLLAGEYTLKNVTIYKMDNTQNKEVRCYSSSIDPATSFKVTEGGLVLHDILIDVVERGHVKFRLVKDFSDFDNLPATRSDVTRQYTFDEIKAVDITLASVMENGEASSTNLFKINGLPAKFSQHFDEENMNSDKEGYKTSSIQCDSIISLAAGRYRVVSYKTYSSTRDVVPLEECHEAAKPEYDIVIEDNKTTKADVRIKLHETDEYIKDNYALKAIWESLDGPNWCYDGESYQRGLNWDFNKDVDLWCEQPGVQVHSNGRIARIDLSNFGFKGEMSPAIGQLTELIELYLGTHNDTNIIYDPSLDMKRSHAERQRNMFDDQRAYLLSIHPAVQMSEPCARALIEKGLYSPAMALYEQYKEADIIDKKSGTQTIRKYDMNHGVLVNGLTKLPAEIGNLKKLETLNIANSPIVSLPAEIGQLESLSSIEIYNCPNMEKFPTQIGELPSLRSVNISNNKQWSSEEIAKGFEALAKGESRKLIEIFYARENNLTKLPKAWFGEGGFEAIGLLDLAFNQISELEPLGKDVAFTQLYLDNNQIESIPHDSNGYYCGYDDVENFSVNYNKLTKIPNIFNSNSTYAMNAVSFAGNQIGTADEICEGEKSGSYKGIKCKTFTLSMNPLKRYPKALADSNSLFEYIVASACQIETIPEGCFSHKNAINHMSFDLSYNRLTKFPKDFHAGNMPYLYGMDISFNRFSNFPFNPLDAAGLTVLAVRSQRDAEGYRCLKEWPEGIYQHVGLRGLYLGSNDLGKVTDTISTLCYYLDISDNPNIVFDASDICYAWQVGAYILFYDKSQKILNCDMMLQ